MLFRSAEAGAPPTSLPPQAATGAPDAAGAGQEKGSEGQGSEGQGGGHMAEGSSSDGAEQRVSSEAGAPEVDTQMSETGLSSSQVQDVHEMEIEKPVEEPETSENGT